MCMVINHWTNVDYSYYLKRRHSMKFHWKPISVNLIEKRISRVRQLDSSSEEHELGLPPSVWKNKGYLETHDLPIFAFWWIFMHKFVLFMHTFQSHLLLSLKSDFREIKESIRLEYSCINYINIRSKKRATCLVSEINEIGLFVKINSYFYFQTDQNNSPGCRHWKKINLFQSERNVSSCATENGKLYSDSTWGPSAIQKCIWADLRLRYLPTF